MHHLRIWRKLSQFETSFKNVHCTTVLKGLLKKFETLDRLSERELRLNKNIHITSRAQQDPVLARAVAQLPMDPGPCPNVAATWTCWISSPYKVLPYMAWVGLTERWCCLIWIWSCFVSFPVCGFVQLYCARFWCPPRSFSCWEFRVRWKSPGIRQQEDSKSWRR